MDSEQRALRAKQLMDDPLLTDILDGIKEAAISAWLSTSVDGREQRDFSWLTVKVVDRITVELQGEVDGHRISMANVVKAPK